MAVNVANGQSFDELITSKKGVDCDDVTFNANRIIRDLLNENQTLEVYEFLDYWESNCGEIEQIFRLRTILDIKGRNFNISGINSETLDFLIAYKMQLNLVRDSINNSTPIEKEYFVNLDSYDKMTQELARNAISNNIDEQLLLDFYAADDPSYDEIKNAPETCRLRQVYDDFYGKFFTSAIDILEFRYLVMVGGIYHLDDLSIFGTRPSFGGIMGFALKRHSLDFLIDLRFGPSDQTYSFVFQNELLTRDNYTSFYTGGEYTYNFLSTRRLNIGISGGLGYEWIYPYNPSDDDLDDDSVRLPSFNRNVGLGFEYKYGKKGHFFGIQLRYHWADYKNTGGTPLKGNYLNLRVVWGKRENPTVEIVNDFLDGNIIE